MAIALTSDPIIPAADAATLLSWDTGDELNLAINAASERFLKFTGRLAINDTAVVQIEAMPPRERPVVWLRATPVDTGEDFTVEVYQDGASSLTLGTADYDLEDVKGRLTMKGHGIVGSRPTRRLVVTYTGGWTVVPGDIMGAALALMRLEKRRRDGAVGVSSASADSAVTATTFNIGNLPREISDVWQAYKVY